MSRWPEGGEQSPCAEPRCPRVTKGGVACIVGERGRLEGRSSADRKGIKRLPFVKEKVGLAVTSIGLADLSNLYELALLQPALLHRLQARLHLHLKSSEIVDLKAGVEAGKHHFLSPSWSESFSPQVICCCVG